MRVARLHAAGDVRLHDEPVPTPGPGELLVRVEAVGLCGSDLHWYEDGGIGGTAIARPIVLGHEFAGRTGDGRLVALEDEEPVAVDERGGEHRGHAVAEVAGAGFINFDIALVYVILIAGACFRNVVDQAHTNYFEGVDISGQPCQRKADQLQLAGQAFREGGKNNGYGGRQRGRHLRELRRAAERALVQRRQRQLQPEQRHRLAQQSFERDLTAMGKCRANQNLPRVKFKII